MTPHKALALAAAMWLAMASTARADVQITLQNGRVSLVAKDATVRQILTEWAKVGHTKIVNLERIPGGPVTLELRNVSEQQALDVLLRSVSGYMAAPRATMLADASAFDRIIVMPTSVAPRAPVAAAPAPTFQPPGTVVASQFPPQQAEDNSDDERPTTNVQVPARGPVFSAFPRPQIVNPQQGNPQQGAPTAAPGVFPTGQQSSSPPPAYPAAPGTQPTSPFGGVAVPGMIVPAPPQPGAQPATGQPQPPGSQL